MIYNKLLKLGFSKLSARLTSDVLYFAESNKRKSHGYSLLKNIEYLVSNEIVKTHLKLDRKIHPNGLIEIDCNNSIGYACAAIACRYGIKLAKEFNLSVITLNNIDHIGALKYYTAIMAMHDCIGFISVNGKPRIALPETNLPFMGTTPISIGIPTDSQAIAIDLCLAQKSVNQIKQSKLHTNPIGLNEKGVSSNISNDVLNGGSIFPIGDQKGASIAFALKLLFEGLIGHSKKGNHPVLMIIANANKITGFKKRSGICLKEAIQIIKSNDYGRVPGTINFHD